jgi:hypothetical protein
MFNDIGMLNVKLDRETASNITALTLRDSLQYLEEELRQHKEEGEWLHPEDAYSSEFVLIPALRALIPYFGGPL